jgi:hypothetical protein
MDPIHPIIPQSPTLPPVTPAARAGVVNRDGGGPGAQPQPRRRKPSARGPRTPVHTSTSRSDGNFGQGLK